MASLIAWICLSQSHWINLPPIAYTYDGAEKLTIKKDITYCVINDVEQSFDFYYPKNC